MLKTIEIDGQIFTQVDVKLPISAFQGSKTCYLGFDATIFQNRYKNYDKDIDIKIQKIENFLKTYKGMQKLSNESYYIDELELYIDLRLNYKHNFNAFNKSNKFHKNCLNQLIEKDEKEIIQQWCIIDVDIRKKKHEEKKKYLEVFNYYNDEDLKNQINRIFIIKRSYSNEELSKEMTNLLKSVGNYASTPVYNKIVAHFNPHIYNNENIHYSNCIDRREHIENCRFLQYKLEHELSDTDILINYRFNKYVTYYSYFSPLWAKAFIKDYSPKRVLDMFGGWGHRYLAFLEQEYIYNDYWRLTYDGVSQIHNFCTKYKNLPFKLLLNEDASTYEFNKKINGLYDTIFTCPPYENFEIYDNKRFKNHKDFLIFWDNSVKNSIHKDLKIFAFIVKNNLGKELLDICNNYGLKLQNEIVIGRNIQHHYNRLKNDKIREHLYVLMF